MPAMPLVYGPVVSRRLRKSLGINVLGDQKICSFNCAYCDLGPTSLTMNQIRREYVYPSMDSILSAVTEKLTELGKDQYDAITLSGNGEPLLHPKISEIITAIGEIRNQMAPHAKFVIFTNAAHIQSRKLIYALDSLDERIIKIDAGHNTILKKVNEPLIRLTVDRLVQDAKKLKDCIIQSTFIDGALTNTSNEHIEDWLEIVGMIQPKNLQLMTPTRPMWRTDVKPVSEDTLETIASRVRRRLPSIEISVFAR